jgi:hypothetical protein
MIKHCKQAHKGNVGFTMRKFDKSKLPRKEASAALGGPAEECSDMPEVRFTPPSSDSLKRKKPSKSGSVKKKVKLGEDNEDSVLTALSKLYTEVRSNIIQDGEEQKFYRCMACQYTNDQKWCVVRHVSNSHPESNDFALIVESHRRTEQKKNSSCKICGKAATSYFDIKKHVLSVHFNYGIYNCKYCTRRGHSKLNLSEHVRSLHANETQEIIEYPDPLIKMNKKMDKFCAPKKQDDGKYKCLFCPFTRPSANHVEQHLRKVHLNYLNPFKCLYCGYSAKCKDSVRLHHYKWHKEEYFTIVLVKAPDFQKSTPQTPTESPPPSKRGKRLSSESSSMSEVTPTAGAKKRKRQESPSRTPTMKLVKYVPGREAEELLKEESQPRKVIKVESPAKKVKSQPLKVKIGPKFSLTKSVASDNLRCQLCGKIMSYEGRLKTHIMMHLDYRPYCCSQPRCTSRFIEKSGVDKHTMFIHHKASKYRYVIDEDLEERLSRLMKGEEKVHSTQQIGVRAKVEKVEETKVKLEQDPPSVPSTSEQEEESRERRVHLVTGELGSPNVARLKGRTVFSCPHCDYTNENRTNCSKHIRFHGPKKYKCCYCNHLGHIPYSIKEHWTSHHKKLNKPFAFIKVSTTTSIEKANDQDSTSSEEFDDEIPKKKTKVAEHSAAKQGEAGSVKQNHGTGNVTIRPRKFDLVKGQLGEPYEEERNKKILYCCPHCDHKNELKHNCLRHMQLHGPKVFKCKECNLIGTAVIDVTKHCLRIHGKNGIIRLSAEQAIAMEEKQMADLKKSDIQKPQTLQELEIVQKSTENQGATDDDSARINWITQQLGWPKPVKNKKFGYNKKWRCRMCPLSDRVRSVVVIHMESHLKVKYSDRVSGEASASNMVSESQETPCPDSSQDYNLYAEVIRQLGRPKASRSGMSFKKKWRCTRCPFSSLAKSNIYKHMQTHLKETASDSCRESGTKGSSTPNEDFKPENVLPLKKVRKRDGSVIYRCQHCPFESESVKSSKMHHVKHGPKRYKCVYCDFKGHYTSEVVRHCRKHPHKPARYLMIENNSQPGESDTTQSEGTSENQDQSKVVSSRSGSQDRNSKRIKWGELPVNKVDEGGSLMYKCPNCSYSTDKNKYYRKHYIRWHAVRPSGEASPSEVKCQRKDINQQTKKNDPSELTSERKDDQLAQEKAKLCHVKFQCGRCSDVITDNMKEMKKHQYHKHRGKKLKYNILGKDEKTQPKQGRRCDVPVPPLPEPDAEGVYHCSKCTYEASEKVTFVSHWKAHVRGYTCTICGYLQEWL